MCVLFLGYVVWGGRVKPLKVFFYYEGDFPCPTPPTSLSPSLHPPSLNPPLPLCSFTLSSFPPAPSKNINYNNSNNTPIVSCKCMTALVTIGLVEATAVASSAFPAGLNTPTTVSRAAAAMVVPGCTSAGLVEGEGVTLWELLHGLMLPSGNDAAVALAEALGPLCAPVSEAQWVPYAPAPHYNAPELHRTHAVSRFTAEMNRAAAALGMRGTAFANPHGLTHAQHCSTAWDVARLASAAMGHGVFRALVGAKKFKRGSSGHAAAGGASAAAAAAAAAATASTASALVPLPLRKPNLENTNQFLGDVRTVPGSVICGVKTGITPGAGACLVLMTCPVGGRGSGADGGSGGGGGGGGGGGEKEEEGGGGASVCAMASGSAPEVQGRQQHHHQPLTRGEVYLSVCLGSESRTRRFIDSTQLLAYAAEGVAARKLKTGVLPWDVK